MKKRIIALLFIFFIVITFGCQKEELELELGDYIQDFEVNTVYQAVTDGFVVVNVSSDNGSAFKASLLSDINVEPFTELASVLWKGGTMTVPIKKGNYWKVTHNNMNNDRLKILISWFPLQYN